MLVKSTLAQYDRQLKRLIERICLFAPLLIQFELAKAQWLNRAQFHRLDSHASESNLPTCSRALGESQPVNSQLIVFDMMPSQSSTF